MNAGTIDAVLTLNATGFDEGLKSSLTAVSNFKRSLEKDFNFNIVEKNITELHSTLGDLIEKFNQLDNKIGNLKNIDQLSQVISRISKSMVQLSDDSLKAEQGINIINAIFEQWENTLNNTEIKVKNITKVIHEVGTASIQSANQMESLRLNLINLDEKFTRIQNQAQMMANEFRESLQFLTHMANGGVEAFNEIEATSNSLKRQIASMNSEFERSKAELLEFANTGVEAFNRLGRTISTVATKTNTLRLSNTFNNPLDSNSKLNESIALIEKQSEAMSRNGAEKVRNMGYTGKLTAEEEKLAVSEEKTSTSTEKATQSMNRQTTATSRLGKAMSSLKMIGTMVGSMMVWNFAHNLITATRETVNAKSEMEGYFQMLNFGQSQIDDFNKALDETVAKFPRLNKYALGETISSIGVEFELTTEEMKKAMPVVSMITSEYLRAGRNVNEASLAVKDILQGEFQRLSRETGVKGDQLMEAGWSGDKNDVMGLLEALDKVGKSRNWDVFVTKANSLNDAVLILQNRFGEWSADMVNRVQPAILGVFNSIITMSSLFGSALNGVMDWLSGDGIAQGIVKWGGLATAIGTVTTAYIHSRTGAGLLQIAQMGLKDSIIATTLSLDAEVVAENGSTFAIAKKVSGLKSEIIAQRGAKTTILAKVLGLDMETFAQHGLRTAILSTVTGMEAETVASMKLTTILKQNKVAILGLGLSMTALIGTIGLLVYAYGGLAMEIKGNTEKMKDFHKLVNEGDEVLKEYNSRIESLYARTKELKQLQSKYTKGSKEYINVGKAHEQVVNSINQALEDRKNLEEAISISEKAQEKYTADKEVARLDYERRINQAIIDTGVSSETAKALSNDYLRQANDGAELLSKTIERLKIDYDSSAKGIVAMATAMEDLGYDSEEIIDSVHELQTANDFIIRGEIQMGEAESFTEYLSGWLTKQYGEISVTISNIKFKLKQDDIIGAFKDAWKGVVYGIAGTIGATPDEVRELVESRGGWSDFTIDFLPIKAVFNLIEKGLSALPDGTTFFPLEALINSIQEGLNQLSDLGTMFSEWIGNADYSSVGETITTAISTYIVNPITSAIVDGVMNIPLIGSLMQLFSTITDGNVGSSEKGRMLADAFSNALLNIIHSIPVVGDITRLIESIIQVNPTASGKGHGVGQSIKDGVKNGLANLSSMIIQEFMDALNGVGQLGKEAYNTAQKWANQLWEGVNSILQRKSPGFFHDQIKLEFGTDVPNAIDESGASAYASAQAYAQNMYAGMNSVENSGFGLGSVVGEYQDDAQTIASSSEMMGLTTTDAFNEMGVAINTTTGQMANDVGTQYTSMQQKQGSMLQTMKTQNLTAYNEMYLKSNQSLIQMRDSTSNVTNQMISAWAYMKDSIVASANQLKSQSTSHFNQLSNTIGEFYGKIQNPSRWGAGTGSGTNVRTSRNSTVGRSLAHAFTRHGAGARTGSSMMTVGQAKRLICPNGDCGSLFDGYSLTDKINLDELIANLEGEHGFGWGDWSGSHFDYIRKTSNEWGMKSPRINLVGGIDTNATFKVGEFENGTPKVSFSTFQSIAESIFSAIPYRYYYDSSWKGSWLGALQAGACNCSDGADALIALASVFGFSGYKKWGKWGNDGHFWAVINGKTMDTTAWQGKYGWTSPKVTGYGSPSVRRGASNSSSQSTSSRNVTVINDFTGATIYGVDDLDGRIKESTKEALREELNDPYAVAL